MTSKVKILLLMCVAGVFVFIRVYNIQCCTGQEESLPVCSCDSCLLEEKDWFSKRFQKSMVPFLSAKYSLPMDAFNWWKRLQIEKRSYDVFNKTVNRLFQMFPPNPDRFTSNPDQCRTCAVVGNSGNLKGSRYGRLIDFHDVIIRMNSAKVAGFEADVGTRTTHHVMYPESAIDLANNTHLVLFPFKIMDLEWLEKAFTTGFHGRSYMPIRSKVKANKDLVMIINPAFMKYVHEIWLNKKGGYSSTGFMALIMALHICDEVHVFGFGADKDGNWSHYWEPLRNKKLGTGLHPGTHEYNTVLQLARQLKIKFYLGR
ncbi:CMP-N-acetylneuraminate-beta-galactosamide-alpha-2,3-sialyltransferase 1-like isoform X2 [Cheilinus undulatus]|nr:CMP-N-acetylneuraminate-beta-galactosamide-alpha-2,3-sialyltransferase 1-like isoform X2 [Cheilinus undulatus]XP_041664182.1 CMP-N-acetylneuraminate-beta-galactosamide-alpha-2,3-sialyltransferase 1-like isoform X2 [Cheilinus undulatus]